MFVSLKFDAQSIRKYWLSALNDLEIAQKSKESEVTFRFCYDALLKLAITFCAKNGKRVRAKMGHHMALIKQLSIYLDDEEIEILGNSMRNKRNWSLYDGGMLISAKEADAYLRWLSKIFKKGQKLLKF